MINGGFETFENSSSSKATQAREQEMITNWHQELAGISLSLPRLLKLPNQQYSDGLGNLGKMGSGEECSLRNVVNIVII